LLDEGSEPGARVKSSKKVVVYPDLVLDAREVRAREWGRVRALMEDVAVRRGRSIEKFFMFEEVRIV
jgi:hypothetical protein